MTVSRSDGPVGKDASRRFLRYAERAEGQNLAGLLSEFEGENAVLRFLFCLFIVSSFATASADESHFVISAKRVVFLGDSITNAGHYIADIETQLRLQTSEALPELINLGLSSETCSGLSEPDHPFPRPDVHERLQRVLDKAKPDVVVACYGMNDGIYYPFSEDRFAEYQRGVRELSSKVQASGAKLILLTPPPFDPQPLRKSEGKLLPAGESKYAWFAIYENYDEVIARYADWVRNQRELALQIIDVHTPLQEFLQQKRKKNPQFQFANDGVHMNAAGHEVMAKAILQAWRFKTWRQAPPELRQKIKQKETILHDAWLSHVGHKRPGVKAGLPLAEAQEKAQQLQREIEALTAD